MVAMPLAAFLHGPAHLSANAPLDDSLLLKEAAPTMRMDQILTLEFPVITSYVTQKNDDFWRICKRLCLSADLRDSVRSSSDLQFLNVDPGTTLSIPNRKGTLYVPDPPENLDSISKDFSRGRVKGNHFAQDILEANGYPLPDLQDPERKFPKNTIFFMPGVLKPMGLPQPLKGRVSSGFGMRKHPVLGITRPHKGMDIPKPYGTPVQPSRKGTVTFAGWEGGYGNMIEIRHTLKYHGQTKVFFTRYGHLSKILVHVGQVVGTGTLIGRVGSTGISTGPHLHFEVRDGGGEAHNPRNY
jgi:murein DD-endopeptidase MepM/ murein hydrolase activator NlpD